MTTAASVGGVGRFAGKTVFGAAPAAGATAFLTTWTVKGGQEGAPIQLPAMSARVATDRERCLLYTQSDGTVRVQMASLLWVTFMEDLGWLGLSAEPADAAAFVLDGNPLGQHWQVVTPDGPAKVFYTVGNPSPILTVNEASGAYDAFAPTVVTPSLDAIVAAKACPDGDFANVDLQGQDVSGVDFTLSRFTSATLTGAVFARTTLVQASFRQATLAGIRCDGAVLDQADLTEADLRGVSWGSPASARRVVLDRCRAQGAVLGGQATPLDCTEASLTSGDFSDADLRGLVLTRAQAGGAVLVRCRLDKANLDGANLQGVVALDAVLSGASMKGVTAQGASFVRADLSAADLSEAKMGAKAYLFTLPGTFGGGLDRYPYPQPDLVAAFSGRGVTIAAEDPVVVVAKGARWTIEDPAGPYDLVVDAAGGIEVFKASPDLRPAVLRGAVCQGTRAPGASLSGADLRGVRWYGSPATLDHADLESAALSGSLLLATDFTQAYLSGADLSNCVLVQARLRKCLVGLGGARQPVSLEGSLLQGADFTETTLLGGLLVDAAVALVEGVPLFTLPLADQQYLTTTGIATIAPAFADAGQPLGTAPTVSRVQAWAIDNRQCQEPSAPRSYRVQATATQLRVYDGGAGTYLFPLPSSLAGLLAAPTAPSQLVTAFGQQGFALATAAPITARPYWDVRPSEDAPPAGPVSYPYLRVYAGTAALTVYGSVLVRVRDLPDLDPGLAFTATQGLDAALNPGSLGPSGHPRAWVDQGLLDWQALMTAARPPLSL